MPLAAQASRLPPSCALGRHMTRRPGRDAANPDMQRATCRHCGCALVRSLATRRWVFSGMLG